MKTTAVLVSLLAMAPGLISALPTGTTSLPVPTASSAPRPTAIQSVPNAPPAGPFQSVPNNPSSNNTRSDSSSEDIKLLIEVQIEDGDKINLAAVAVTVDQFYDGHWYGQDNALTHSIHVEVISDVNVNCNVVFVDGSVAPFTDRSPWVAQGHPVVVGYKCSRHH